MHAAAFLSSCYEKQQGRARKHGAPRRRPSDLSSDGVRRRLPAVTQTPGMRPQHKFSVRRRHGLLCLILMHRVHLRFRKPIFLLPLHSAVKVIPQRGMVRRFASFRTRCQMASYGLCSSSAHLKKSFGAARTSTTRLDATHGWLAPAVPLLSRFGTLGSTRVRTDSCQCVSWTLP